jgi:hypothetical protein
LGGVAQAQAGTLARALGREERIEDSWENLRADPGPAVFHLDRDKLAAQTFEFGPSIEDDLANRNDQQAAVRHGVARVDPEIEQSQFQLTWVDARVARAFLNPRSDLDVAAQRALQHLADIRQRVR